MVKLAAVQSESLCKRAPGVVGQEMMRQPVDDDDDVQVVTQHNNVMADPSTHIMKC